MAEVDGGSRKAIHMPGIFVSINYVVFRSCPLFPINQPKTHNASKGYGGVYVGRVIVLRKVEDSIDETSFLLLAHSVVY